MLITLHCGYYAKFHLQLSNRPLKFLWIMNWKLKFAYPAIENLYFLHLRIQKRPESEIGLELQAVFLLCIIMDIILKANTGMQVLVLADFLFSIYSWHPGVKIGLIFILQMLTVGVWLKF